MAGPVNTTLFRRLFLRLVAGAGVVWGAATLTFVAIHVTGGDTAIAILGGDNAWASPEVLASVRHDYGLDQPLPVQYARYIGRLAVGDLGESYRLRIPVERAIRQQLGPTVVLTASASVTAVVLAIFAALLTAKRAHWLQAAASGMELAVSSVPAFVVGILFLLVFTFKLRWLPASGTGGWRTLLLPTLTLALPIGAVLAQVLRQELEAILDQPFVLTARARGMRDASVRLTRALRHALSPLTTLTGFLVAGLLGGAVIVETLFARQGVGRLMLDATANKDIPIVLGITLLAATVYVVVNLAVDLLYGLIDPRIRIA